jgi:hypothetical protein
MTAPGNTVGTDLEVLMTRLKQLREYRSRLIADVTTVIDKFMAAGRPAGAANNLNAHIRQVNLRIRLIDEQVNLIIANEPRVLQNQVTR